MKKQLLLLVMMLLSLPTIAYNYYDVKYDGIYYVFDAYLQAGVTYYNYNDYNNNYNNNYKKKNNIAVEIPDKKPQIPESQNQNTLFQDIESP